MTAVIHFFLTSSSSLLCSAQTTIAKDSLEQYKLSGAVKQVLHSMYEATLVKDSFSIGTQINSNTWPSELTFQKDGYRLIRSYCNMYNQECRHSIDEYDRYGRLISQQKIEEDDVVWDKKNYTYSPSGELQNMTQYFREQEELIIDHTIEFTLDGQGRIITEKKYDEDGLFKRTNTYRYPNNISAWTLYKKIDDNGAIEEHEERTFDHKGRITQQTQSVDGELLEKKVYTYAEDSLTAMESYTLENGKPVLRDATYILYNKEDRSLFILVNQDGKMDTARYVWEIRDHSGRLTRKQRCKFGILTVENIYEYDSLGNLVLKQRFDYEKVEESQTKFKYAPDGKLAAEFKITESGEDSTRWYYDEYGNWIYLLEHKKRPDGVIVTHVQKRLIEYFN